MALLVEEIRNGKATSTDIINFTTSGKCILDDSSVLTLKAASQAWSTDPSFGSCTLRLTAVIGSSIHAKSSTAVLAKYLKIVVFVSAHAPRMSTASDAMDCYLGIAPGLLHCIATIDSFPKADQETISKCSMHLLQSVALTASNLNESSTEVKSKMVVVIDTVFQCDILGVISSAAPAAQILQLLLYFADTCLAFLYSGGHADKLTLRGIHLCTDSAALPDAAKIKLLEMISRYALLSAKEGRDPQSWLRLMRHCLTVEGALNARVHSALFERLILLLLDMSAKLPAATEHWGLALNLCSHHVQSVCDLAATIVQTHCNSAIDDEAVLATIERYTIVSMIQLDLVCRFSSVCLRRMESSARPRLLRGCVTVTLKYVNSCPADLQQQWSKVYLRFLLDAGSFLESIAKTAPDDSCYACIAALIEALQSTHVLAASSLFVPLMRLLIASVGKLPPTLILGDPCMMLYSFIITSRESPIDIEILNALMTVTLICTSKWRGNQNAKVIQSTIHMLRTMQHPTCTGVNQLSMHKVLLNLAIALTAADKSDLQKYCAESPPLALETIMCLPRSSSAPFSKELISNSRGKKKAAKVSSLQFIVSFFVETEGCSVDRLAAFEEELRKFPTNELHVLSDGRYNDALIRASVALKARMLCAQFYCQQLVDSADHNGPHNSALNEALSSSIEAVQQVITHVAPTTDVLLFSICKSQLPSLFRLLGFSGRLHDQVATLRLGFDICYGLRNEQLHNDLVHLLAEMLCVYEVMIKYYNLGNLPALHFSLPPEFQAKLEDPMAAILAWCHNPMSVSTAADFQTQAETLYVSYKSSKTLSSSLCICVARLLMVRFAEHRAALAWAKRALTVADSQPESKIYYVEATLLITEIYDQCGFVEGCLSYLAEALSLSRKSSIAMFTMTQLHALRLWNRLDSATRALECAEKIAANKSVCFLCGLAATAAEYIVHSIPATCNFRFVSDLWDCSSHIHTSLPIAPRQMIVEEIKSQRKCGTAVLSCPFSGASKCLPEACRGLQQLPESFYSFDVLRQLRRNAAFNNHLNSGDPFLTFCLAAASCNTSFDCFLSLQSSTSCDISLQISNACCGNSAALETIRQQLDRALTYRDDSNKGGAISIAVYSSGRLLLGRYSVRSGPCLVAFDADEQVASLMNGWKSVMEDNKSLLKRTVDASAVGSWTNADKKAWWAAREQVDRAINESLLELQHLLGPWRCLLATSNPFTAPSVSSEVEKFVLDNKKSCKAGVDVTTQSLAQWMDVLQAASSPMCLTEPLNETELSKVLDILISTVFHGTPAQLLKLAKVLKDILPVSFVAESVPPCSAANNKEELCKLFADLKVTELRSKLKERGASTVGKKEELLSRIIDLVDIEKENVDPLTVSNNADGLSCGENILILDETLQSMPWECMSCVQHVPISRIPGLCLLLRLLDEHNTDIAEPRKAWFLVDPENNLPSTREALLPFLDPYIKHLGWQGFVSEIPSDESFREHHESTSVFIYCGHGGGEVAYDAYHLRKISCPVAFLWGCSSGQLVTNGIHDPTGVSMSYLIGGSPCVVGNLWDVTDKDLDKMSVYCMDKLFRPYLEAMAPVSVHEALSDARTVCKMARAVGAAAVIYGLPRSMMNKVPASKPF